MDNKQIEALQTANEYMERLEDGIREVVEFFQSGDITKACEIIPDITSGIEWIIDVINLTKESQAEKIDVDVINEKLQELIEAFENQDYILVGDLFNYELLPLLKDVHSKIVAIIAN